MKKNSKKTLICIVILSIIFTNSYTYKLLGLIFTPICSCRPFQFLIASFAFLFEISVTEKKTKFQEFWNKSTKLRNVFEKLLRISTRLFWGITTFLVSVPAILSRNKKEIAVYMEVTNTSIKEYDEKPLLIRFLILSACISLIWIAIDTIMGVKEATNELISAVFDIVIPLLNIPFLYSEIK